MSRIGLLAWVTLAIAVAGCGEQRLEPPGLGRGATSSSPVYGNTVRAEPDEHGTCASITSTVTEHFAKMKQLMHEAETEQTQPPSTIMQAYERMFGPEGAGIAALQQREHVRLEIDRLKAVLARKGCPIVNW